jgi:hypothetical protein
MESAALGEANQGIHVDFFLCVTRRFARVYPTQIPRVTKSKSAGIAGECKY